MTNIWSFDFGEANGIARGFYGPNNAYRVEDYLVVAGGIDGFIEWWQNLETPPSIMDVVVAERYEPTPGESNLFTAKLEGVRQEGALAALYDGTIVWQGRSAKQKDGMYDAILKANGLWVENKDVMWEDSRDVNDAIIHAVEHLRRIGHIPTLRAYFPDDHNAV